MTDFRHRAVCRDVDPETFYPTAEPGSPAYGGQVADAKAVCARCPVREACLEFALTGLPYGIAGGLTEDERRKLALSRRLHRTRETVSA